MDKITDKLLEADGSFFDKGLSPEALLNRKVSLARVLDQAKKALNKATETGQDAIAGKLSVKVDYLQELLDRADEVADSLSDSDGSSGEGSGSDTDPSEGKGETPKSDEDGEATEPDENDGDTEDNTTSEEPAGEEEDSGTDEKSKDGSEDNADETEDAKDSEKDSTSGTGESDDTKTSDDTTTDGGGSGSSEEDSSSDDKGGSASGGSDSSDGSAMEGGESSADSAGKSTKLIDPFKKKQITNDPNYEPPEDQETVFDAAKRILSKLTGESRRGATDGLIDLLSKKGYTFSESLDKPLNKPLTEAITKVLTQMSDEEFHDELAKTMELVDQVLKIDYSDDLDDRVKAIQRDASSRISRMELDKEDAEYIKTDRKETKAFERENDKYKKVKPLSGLDTFKSNLFRAVKDQVEESEDEVDSWSALDRRHEDDPTIIKKGHILDDGEDDIPSINVYFDQSGSWSNYEVEIGKRAISVINEFHENKEIKLNIFYISAAGVCTEASVARAEGGAEGWAATLEHIQASKAKNVVVLSDQDLDYFEWSNRPTGTNKRVVIEGCVWWLWKNSSVSKKALKELVGRRGNFQYQFTTY